VRFWEIKNEPDLLNFPLDTYRKILAAATTAIHQVEPTARVMNGGFVTINDNSIQVEPDYVEKFLRRTGKNEYDILALHLHQPFPQFRSMLIQFRRMMRDTGVEKPFFMNETALHSMPGIHTEFEQAEVLWKKLLFSWKESAIGYVWHNLRNSPETSQEGHFGIMTQDLQPKPVYAAYYTLINHFTGAKFIKSLRDEKDGVFYLFRHPDGGWESGKGEPRAAQKTKITELLALSDEQLQQKLSELSEKMHGEGDVLERIPMENGEQRIKPHP